VNVEILHVQVDVLFLLQRAHGISHCNFSPFQHVSTTCILHFAIALNNSDSVRVVDETRKVEFSAFQHAPGL